MATEAKNSRRHFKAKSRMFTVKFALGRGERCDYNSRMKFQVCTIALAGLVAGCGVKQSTTLEPSATKEKPRPVAASPVQPKAKPEPAVATPDAAKPETQTVAKIAPQTQFEPTTQPQSKDPEKIMKTDAEWRAILSPEEYRILRQKGTERAFTGKFDHHFKKGTYTCKGCGTALFDSNTKYNSGCGWPAFFKAKENTIAETVDRSYGMIRTEITCKKCDGHLGHVFDDGPNPTGIRYCVNSASMGFVPAVEEAPAKPAPATPKK